MRGWLRLVDRSPTGEKAAKFGMAKFGAEEIWHQLLNTTAQRGTKQIPRVWQKNGPLVGCCYVRPQKLGSVSRAFPRANWSRLSLSCSHGACGLDEQVSLPTATVCQVDSPLVAGTQCTGRPPKLHAQQKTVDTGGAGVYNAYNAYPCGRNGRSLVNLLFQIPEQTI